MQTFHISAAARVCGKERYQMLKNRYVVFSDISLHFSFLAESGGSTKCIPLTPLLATVRLLPHLKGSVENPVRI